MSIEATVLLDSINCATGRRVTTFLLRYPRFIHSEVLTHRVFARNSASSRAVPVLTVLKTVYGDPAEPVRWGGAKKGMQDDGPLPNGRARLVRLLWRAARYPAMAAAYLMTRLGLHKQVANRLLEPWAHMTVVLTGTEWENFYRLRAHPDAQPEFQALARRMLAAHAASTPQRLLPGDWHLPFADRGVFDSAGRTDSPEYMATLLARCTARCARTSYVNFFGKNDPADDHRLHDQLVKNGHMSPAEHCCRAEDEDRFFGHLRSFLPYRKLLANENLGGGRPFDPVALAAELKV